MMNRMTFRKIMIASLACLMLVSAAGCGTANASSAPVSSDVVTPTDDFKVGDATPEEIANASAAEIIAAGDADETAPASSITIQQEPITAAQASSLAGSEVKVFRGTIVDFAVNDAGQTVWILAQEIGADYGATFLNVAVTPELPMGSSGQQADIGNTTHLEVFYTTMNTQGMTPEVTAVAVNVLLPVDLTIFNGKVAEITPDPDKPGTGSILLDPIDEGKQQTVFNYSTNETTWEGISPESIKPGDALHILYDGISTRSLPPQSFAGVIRPYVECEACPLVPKVG